MRQESEFRTTELLSRASRGGVFVKTSVTEHIKRTQSFTMHNHKSEHCTCTSEVTQLKQRKCDSALR